MRRLLLLICVFFIMSTGAGCESAALDANNRIIAPHNDLTPLKGEWIVDSCVVRSEEKAVNKSEEWIGKTARFSQNAIAIGDIVSDDIGYKVKLVNAEEYFLHKFNGTIDELGITSKEIQVITVSSYDKFLYEFVKVSDDRVIANIDDEFFCLRKISDKLEDDISKEAMSRSGSDVERKIEDKSSFQSGILLGIRTPVKTENNSNSENANAYRYRTLWIAHDNGSIRPVLEAEDLFLPRMSGFWKLQVREEKKDDMVEDRVLAYSISKNSSNKGVEGQSGNSRKNLTTYRSGVVRRVIQYAGNDYVSIENIRKEVLSSSSKTLQYNELQMLPVDSITNAEGVRISDIAGANGNLAMERAVNSLMETYDDPCLKDLSKEYYEESFGLYRKTGHWFFKGRMNFGQKAQIPYTDYNINLIPPTDLVAYDILYLPWTYIKDKIPGAVDAFTSPNSNMALIQTKEQILVYGTVGDALSETPLKRIKLGKGDCVVMAEWATDYYVNKWESIFIKNNITKEVK